MASAQSAETKKRLSQKLLGLQGIAGVGISRDERGREILVVYVSQPDAGTQVPSEFEGMRVKLIDTEPFRELLSGN